LISDVYIVIDKVRTLHHMTSYFVLSALKHCRMIKRVLTEFGSSTCRCLVSVCTVMFWRDVLCFVLMGVQHTGTWRNRGTV